MSDSKVSVTITNRAPGLQPPVFIAGSFSDPEWIPEPMDYTTSDDGVHTFTKTFQVEPESKIVYKFRAGEGDWWLLNENAPTVTDAAGNRNNVLKAPKAATRDESGEPASEPAQTKLAEQNDPSIGHVPHDTEAYSEIEHPHPVSQVDALKRLDDVGPVRISTPEFIKTITEVSDSAALLDRSTPEPKAPEAAADKHEEQSSTTLLPDAADTAAEVADSAALLDPPTPEPEVGIDATGEGEEPPSEVAAQVADTAATLDREIVGEAPSEVAAQVADTAAQMDTDDSEHHQEKMSPAHKTLTDVKADMRNESLDIAGFSNDHEPVPLFAHECAGLYENDEIPGADEQAPSSSSGHPYENDKEDYDDPTLERFPSTREEIISTVRKVETGLNADQVSVEGVPLSPIARARNSPTAEARNELSAADTSPISRGQQHLPVPPSLTAMDERSLSATSLHSIAEGAENADEDIAGEPKSEYIADVVEKPNGLDEDTETAKKSEAEDIASAVERPPVVHDTASVVQQKSDSDRGPHLSSDPHFERGQQAKSEHIVPLNGGVEIENEATESSEATDADVRLSAHKPTLDSLVTVPSLPVKSSTGLLSPISDDDEAVIVDNSKSKKDTAKSDQFTPERAATPQPEETGSPREPSPNTADPVAESEHGSSGLEAQSPQVVVSKPGETQAKEELLPAAAFGEALDENCHAEKQVSQDIQPLEKHSAPTLEAVSEDTMQLPKTNGSYEQSSEEGETPASSETLAIVNDGQVGGSRSKTAATTSAEEENQTGTLKQRSIARPNPADRTNTPTSVTDSHKEAAKGGNWFSAFLRLIFIDFFGGLVRKLYGGGRTKLVTIAVLLVAMGCAFFRSTTEPEEQVVSY